MLLPLSKKSLGHHYKLVPTEQVFYLQLETSSKQKSFYLIVRMKPSGIMYAVFAQIHSEKKKNNLSILYCKTHQIVLNFQYQGSQARRSPCATELSLQTEYSYSKYICIYCTFMKLFKHIFCRSSILCMNSNFYFIGNGV